MEDEFSSVRWDRESTVVSEAAPRPLSEVSEVVKDKEPVNNVENKNQTPAAPAPDDKDVEDDGSYIRSTVTSPQRESDGQNAYISYLIETKTNSPVFQSTKLKVRRRFSDFVFLYHCLGADYPACALPPLPDKQRLEYLKGDRFGHDFTSRRAYSLSRFLSRMSQHPVLKRAKIYHIFLESNDWNAYKDSLGTKHDVGRSDENPYGNSSMVSDTISDLFISAFKQPQVQQNKEFVEINERCNKLNDNIIKIDKSFQKYVKRLGDLSHNYASFGSLLQKLNQLEVADPAEFDVETLKNGALSPDPAAGAASASANSNAGANSGASAKSAAVSPGLDDPRLVTKELDEILAQQVSNSQQIADANSPSFIKFSKALENLAIGLNQLKKYLDNDYLISLKDLENYIYSIKNLIKAKEQKQIDFEVLSEYLARAIHEKNELLQQTSGNLQQEIGSAAEPHSTTNVSSNPSITLPTPKPSRFTTIASSTSNFLSSKLDDFRGINSTYQKKERLIKLTVKIETLEKEVVGAKKVFELFENEILHEVQYFDVIKSNELKTNLKSLANNYVNYYQGAIKDWEKVEAALEKDIKEFEQQV